MLEDLLQSGMSVEQCNKLFDFELRRIQIGCENEEVELRSKRAREELAIHTKKTRDELVLRLERLQMAEDIMDKTVQLTNNVLQFMDKAVPLLSEGLPEKSAADFVQDHRIKFIIQMVQHLPKLFMDDAPLVPDSTMEGSEAEKEDAPLSIAAFLAENNVVDNENGDIAAAVDRIAERLYKDKYGRDPPKTTTVVPEDTVVETDVYTNADRDVLERACQEYIEEQRPKRRRCARK
jgi:hypothetical protein